jgi:hypothetical protein
MFNLVVYVNTFLDVLLETGFCLVIPDDILYSLPDIFHVAFLKDQALLILALISYMKLPICQTP